MHIHMHIHILILIHIHIHVHIHDIIYIHEVSERDMEERGAESFLADRVSLSIYIYIYREREIYR